MGEHRSQFRVLSLDLEERDALARQVTLLSDALTNLEQALEHSRDIGVAMGILMSSEHVSRECAWDMLRMVSQCQNRKLFLVAADVAQTGQLPLTQKPPGRDETG